MLEPQGPSNSFKMNTSRGSEDTAAVAGVSTEISLNGRRPLTTTCPYCKREITTDIQKIENLESQKAINRCLLFFFCLSFLILFIALLSFAIATGHWLRGLGIFAISLAIAFLLVLSFKKCMCIFGTFHNILHFCPSCNKRLGNSNGLDAWYVACPWYPKQAPIPQHQWVHSMQPLIPGQDQQPIPF